MTTRVKICGITSIEDAICASESGADALGLNFYEPSVRYLADLALACDIAQAAGPLLNVVGLFVDAPADKILRVMEQVPLNTLQFHGNESAEFCEQFKRPYLKALRMKPGENIAELAAQYPSARGILLDTYVKGAPGGTGQVFDWGSVPSSLNNIVLAGGLNPDNVAEAVRCVKPYAVDVSGGVESGPGKKDPQKMNTFVANAKSINSNSTITQSTNDKSEH